MPSNLREKTGRNDPCPCRSGKKHKHCCLKAPAAEDSPWKRQRVASDSLTDDLLAFAKRKFGRDLLDAWDDFNQTVFPPPYERTEGEAQIFMPYYLFDWERPTRRRGARPRVGVVGRSFLERFGGSLSELEALIFIQATTQPVSFYEVLHSAPGESLVLRDLLIGGDTTVVERSASRMLRPGDIVYAQIWQLPEVNTLGRLAPIPFPPRNKVEIVEWRVKLRRKIARQNRELAAADVVRYAEETRALYLHLRDVRHLPPRLCNTDGDSLVFHTLTFRVGSAQVAFDALAPLAWERSKEELLKDAEVTRDGVLCSVEIEWAKPGNKKFKTWDNTILGRLKISGRSLVATVNSKERARSIRAEIERRLGILAVHQSTVSQAPEELVKDREQPAGSAEFEESDGLLDPAVREHIDAMMQSWAHQKIPALGGRSPVEAVADPDGREIVEALLLDMERQYERSKGPGAVRPDIDALRRLLNLVPASV